MRLQPQDEILGRYKVDSLIGRGGMGDVVRAHHRTLGVPVAVKVLGAEAKEPDETIEREALLLARVRHTNVVSVLDVGRTDSGHRCLVMEWLDGEDLRMRLKRQRVLPWYVAVPLASQIAAGLGAIHQAGILHRDLKPANVMLLSGPPEQVKLIDFGLASPARNLPVTGEQQTVPNFVGTPDYASPEQITGQPLDGRSDLYALGVVLYQMLTGDLPFGLEMVRSMRRRLVETAPRVMAPEGGVSVPDRVVALVADLLATTPDERPASAADVAQRLREMEPTGPVQLVWREPVRSAASAARAAVAAAPGASHVAAAPQAPTAARAAVAPTGVRAPGALAATQPAYGLTQPRPQQHQHVTPQPATLHALGRPMADTQRIRPTIPPQNQAEPISSATTVHLALALACGMSPFPDAAWLAAQSGRAVQQVYGLRAMQVIVWPALAPGEASQVARRLLAALRARYGANAVWRTRFVAVGLLDQPAASGPAVVLPDPLRPLVLEMRRLGFRVSDAHLPPAA